ncbi:MAG: S26 family signal peptidase [Syntrophomonadaceae bacterium]
MFGPKLEKSLIPASEWSSAILPILEQGHTLKMPFSGLSMHPLLVGGRDEVLLESVSGRKLKRGDIVLFVQEDGTHVLHRIHHIKNNTYFMLGDAQVWIEGPVPADKVLGIATVLIRKNKMISSRRIDYLIISHLWLLLRPVRPMILKAIKRLRKHG